jgi:predicted heme/steroid binding protein/uncharacterized membrane protein
MREMDGQELKRMNGKEGNPVYVGFQGKVYDVTESSLWNTGVHMARHAAGQDLTAEMEAAPHGPEVLDKFPQVGILKKSGPSAHVKPLPSFLQKAFDRYPLLRRQPHPMTVHFPIAFLMATPLFLVLYALTRNSSFETATGFFAWWVNYGAILTTQVKYKIFLSIVLCVVEGILAIWRVLDPLIIIQSGNLWWIYAILIFCLVPLVTILGHIGGKMVFPS